MSPCGICDSLSLRERVGVREPVSTLAIAAMERFIESQLFEIDLLTDLEPGNPGGETPPSTAGGTPAATEPPPLPDSLFAIPYSRFMGRLVLLLGMVLASATVIAAPPGWVTETPQEFVVSGRFQAGSTGSDWAVVDKASGLARVGLVSAGGLTWVEQATGMTGISAMTTLRQGAQDELAVCSAEWNAVQMAGVGGMPRTLASPVVAPGALVRLTTGHSVNAVVEDLLAFTRLADAPDRARLGAVTGAGVVLFEAVSPAFPEAAQFVPITEATGIPVLVGVQDGVLRIDFVGRSGVLEGGFAVSGPHAAGLLWAGAASTLFSIPKDNVTLEMHRLVRVPVGGALSYPGGVSGTTTHPLPERVVGLDTVPFIDPAFPDLRCLVALRLESTPDTVRLYRVLDAPVPAVELTAFECPAGEAFAGLVTVGEEFLMLSGPGGRVSTWRRYGPGAPGEVPSLRESGSLPAQRPRSAYPNLFLFDLDPFLVSEASFLGSQNRPDWTRVLATGAWAEFDGGVVEGLGAVQAFPLNAPGQVALGNQLLQEASVAGFGAVAGAVRKTVQFSPPAGAYGALERDGRFSVSLRGSVGGDVMWYRRGGAGAWAVYDAAQPPQLTGNDTLTAYAEEPGTGVRSLLVSARYTFDRLPATVPAVAVDADGDGLGDGWEQVFGVDDPAGDTDGDGANALAEYRAGTDPRDAGSRPTDVPPDAVEIALVRVQEGRLQLAWPAELRGYVLEWSADLLVWAPVMPQPLGNSWEEAVGDGQKFYRLRRN